MKILILGASSYVGSKIYIDLKENHQVVGTCFSNKIFDELIQVDLRDKEQVGQIISNTKPELIIDVAAHAKNSWCEENQDETLDLNLRSVEYIVEFAKKESIPVMFISTFAALNPTNIYGESKADAEKAVRTLDSYAILRPSLIFGMSPNLSNDRPFSKFYKNFLTKSDMTYDTSWEFEVTYLDHLSEVIQALLQQDLNRKLELNIVAEGKTTQFKLVSDLVKNTDIKVIPENKNSNLQFISTDQTDLKELGLPIISYDKVVQSIRKEIGL